MVDRTVRSARCGRVSAMAVERAAAAMDWPPWWFWDLDLTSHLERRMEDRDFTEVDLRAMMQKAVFLRADAVEGRFLVETRHRGVPWEVIVEPAPDETLLIVITAYRAGRT